LSASRDRKIILWKLIDGKIMSKCDYPPVQIMDKPQRATRPKPRRNHRATNNHYQGRNRQGPQFRKNKLSSAAQSTANRMKERSGLASQSSGGHQFSPPMSVPQSQPRVNESLRLQSLDGPPDRPPELTNVREVESAKLGSDPPTPHQRKGPGNIEEEEKQQVVDLDCEEG